VASKKKLGPGTPKTWRPTREDIKLLAGLKVKLGVLSETDVIRMSLRALAAKEGVAA